jgi:hypothetical protein
MGLYWRKFIKINNKIYWVKIRKHTDRYGYREGTLGRLFRKLVTVNFGGVGYTLQSITDSLVKHHLEDGSNQNGDILMVKEFKQWDGTYNSD